MAYTKKQKKLAAVAEPKNKITSADLKTLRKKNGKSKKITKKP